MINSSYINFDFTKLKNITHEIAEGLKKMRVYDLDDMISMGTEELFVLYFETFGYPKGEKDLHWAYAIEGAITNTHWQEIPLSRKNDLEFFLHEFRNKFTSKSLKSRG